MPVSNDISNETAAYKLEVCKVFDNLARDDIARESSYTLYVHYLARACWHGSRTVLRQTSPEAEGIFDFTLELHRAGHGQWSSFRGCGIKQEELVAWLDFAGMFLSSLGNYFDTGDRKAVPRLSSEALAKMASISPEASASLEKIIDLMMSTQPSNLWYPSETSQSSYYLGTTSITKEEIGAVTKVMELKKIAPENTRLLKRSTANFPTVEKPVIYEILQTSAEEDAAP